MTSSDSYRTALIYHVYLKNNWKGITNKLIHGVPHDDIYINVNVDWFYLWRIISAVHWLKKEKKVKQVFITLNAKNLAEVVGFKKLRNSFKSKNYSVVTYMHGKGVTKPGNKYIQDWVDMMRYFIIDRWDLCTAAFQRGKKIYGVNLGCYNDGDKRYGPYKFSDFHFSGNFVTVNLENTGDIFFETVVDEDYFGVEGFWGKLCALEEVECPHNSGLNIKNHYLEPYPENYYK